MQYDIIIDIDIAVFLFLSAVFLELLPIYSTDVPWDLSFST
jgi:hypothetical protein